MMISAKKSALPFGAVTLMLLGAALLYESWPESSCEQLERNMQAGFFLRWMPPQLMLVTADKKNFMVNADSQRAGCEAMLLELAK